MQLSKPELHSSLLLPKFQSLLVRLHQDEGDEQELHLGPTESMRWGFLIAKRKVKDGAGEAHPVSTRVLRDRLEALGQEHWRHTYTLL